MALARLQLSRLLVRRRGRFALSLENRRQWRVPPDIGQTERRNISHWQMKDLG